MTKKVDLFNNYDVDILKRIEDTMLNDPSLTGPGEGRTVKSEITNFYKDQAVLVTGGTGFLGKVLVEKLLRCCPEIKTVYLLVRHKQGKDIHTRINENFEDPIFQVLQREQPKFRHKVVGVPGDVSMHRLGLTDADRQTLKDNVSVIFHGAATVRFDAKLKMAVTINIRGTKEILELARECSNLKSLVHVSTAFSNCVRKEIDERFYAPPMRPQDIMELVEIMPEEKLDEMTPNLIGKFPNTYAFTKAIAEDAVREYGQGLPMCVLRPSIVAPTYREPIRGWSDNLYGTTGVLIGAGTGVLRTLHCDENFVADLVPVDMCVNALAAAAWVTAITNSDRITDEIPIYNYVSGCQAPITWGRIMELNMKYGLDVPTMKSIWYYSFTLNKYLYIHMLYVMFLHFVPALIIDTYCTIIGKKPRLFKLYKKIQKFSNVISYFTLQEWKFADDNVQNMWKKLNACDQEIFNFDMNQLDWDEHAQTQLMGLRVYLVKDPASTLPQARIRWERLRMLHRSVQVIASLVAVRLAWVAASGLYLSLV